MTRVSPELLAALDTLLDQALDLPPAELTAWLERLHRTDPDMAGELRALLHAESGLDARGFLRDTARPGIPGGVGASLAGQRIGPYTLERSLGHGGMGSVWLARRDDGRYVGHVAIKLLNLALLDPVGSERFRREGTALARLTHPNVAHLIDAGVTDGGQPYLVLEHVEGQRIDRYCDEHRLDPHARILLFMQVLAAVAHAHAHLIVHRDLKPSNILVTADGNVKLLDFGIAKLLETESAAAERSQLTDLGGLAMTPEYAAPEQALGASVSTASDVYSLGVLLYLLLAGRHPTGEGLRSAAEHIRAILEVEPVPVSAAIDGRAADARSVTPDRLRRMYRGDLDNIVAKALKKDPAQRYTTAVALGDDLRRYLGHEPVQARRDSVLYRARKFVRRNRTAVVAGTLTAAALLGATVFSVSQMRYARQQRDAALLESRRSAAQVELQDLLLSQVSEEPITMRQVLDSARVLLERSHASDSVLLARMLLQLAGNYALLSETEKRGALLARAESLALAGPAAETLPAIRCQMADNHRMLGKYEEARRLLDEADVMLRAGGDPADLVECLATRSGLASEAGPNDEALAAALRAISIKDSLGETRDQTYITLLDFHAHAVSRKQPREAMKIFQRALAAMDSSGRGASFGRTVMQHNFAHNMVKLGETAEAERIFHVVLRRSARSDQTGRIDYQPHIHYAEMALYQGYPDSALKYFKAIVAQARRDTNLYWEGRGLFGAARAEVQLGRLSGIPRAKARLQEIIAAHPKVKNTDDQVPDPLVLDGWVALRTGDTARASTAFLGALESNGYHEGKWRRRLSHVALLAAECALALGRPEEALQLARDARKEVTPDSLAEERSAFVGAARLIEGRAQIALGKTAEGRVLVQQAHTALSNGAGPEHPRTREARAVLENLPVAVADER